MSSDNGIPAISPSADMNRQRRGSITASSAFTSFFRTNSLPQPGAVPFPTPLMAAAATDPRRRLSVTTLGLSGTGTSPTAPSALLRRASLSTSSDSVDENAIDEEDAPRTAPPVGSFTRRMSFGPPSASRPGARGSISPPTNGMQPMPPRRNSSFILSSPPASPRALAGMTGYTWEKIISTATTIPEASPANPSKADVSPGVARSDQGFNWSDQLRSRAESVASGSRPSFSLPSGFGTSPPRAGPAPPLPTPRRDRAASVSDMPAPPAQAPRPRAKPDHFQERILKGDFYMD
ncbi:hypothetical protein VTJ04DRAFT_3557 [Mycothermus thermophilus]|uniref:uncharacterized protein n=1 Tax=Humicola insolens TaxID=85995 RepID=UPI0037438CEB